MNKRLQVTKYVVADFLSATSAWTLFYIFRKLYLERQVNPDLQLDFDPNFYLGLAIIPTFWLALYSLTGAYTGIYRKYRIRELGNTILHTFIGTLVIFFTLILDDEVASYKNYYQSFFVLYGLHFFVTYSFRLILTTRTVKRVHNRQLGFNTVIIGGNERALNIYKEISGLPKGTGNKFVGFLMVNGGDNLLDGKLPYLGTLNKLEEVIKAGDIEEAIIAIESSEHESINRIVNELEGTGVIIKVIPDMYNILSGQVKINSIFGAPLIQINPQIMPAWQRSFKRIMDIFCSLVALFLLSWVYLFIGLAVKLTSKGPAFFAQERIGLHGKPFRIFKFRTMSTDAEKHGPQLSSATDSRITKVGKFLRQTRLDELPQFWNVLIGDMSLVGPRPERQFYIDQIIQVAPHYKHLHKVRPGITSWGQVKYGYAENVPEMVQRLKYDILYIENMTLAIDFKILLYTVIIVVKGTGK